MNSWFPTEENKLFSLNMLANTNSNDFQDLVTNIRFSFCTNDDISDFLASLSLLKGLGLSQITPNESMLPFESLRFFYVDPNWIHCFLDGAMSIGRTVTKDNLHDEFLKATTVDSAYETSNSLRSERFGIEKNNDTPSDIRTGFLLHSQLVSGWPGLEVTCFQKGMPLSILRLENISESIMLCIVEGEMDELTFTEPKESMCFGFENVNDKLFQLLISLKDYKLLNIKEPIIYRNESLGVLDISGLAKNIDTTLKNAGENSLYFSSLEFAAEMIYERVSLNLKLT